MKSTSMIGSLAAVFALAVSSASAVVVNIDFGLGGAPHPGGVVNELYVGTAAAPDSGTVWNAVNVLEANTATPGEGKFGFWSSSVAVSSLLDSNGNTTTLTVTLNASGDTGAFGILDSHSNLGRVATDAVGLMREYLIGFNTPQTVVLGGFTPGTLTNLYLYGAGDQTIRDTAFAVAAENGGQSASTTGVPGGSHELTFGSDYVILNGVVADALGNITISYAPGALSGDTEAPFNGLQVEIIPEPASAALLLGGLLPVAFRRRRAGSGSR